MYINIHIGAVIITLEKPYLSLSLGLLSIIICFILVLSDISKKQLILYLIITWKFVLFSLFWLLLTLKVDTKLHDNWYFIQCLIEICGTSTVVVILFGIINLYY